jgi:hypothetical protein
MPHARNSFSAAAVVIFVLAGYLYSFGSGVFGQKLEFTLLSVLTGALAGFRIGVAIAYGRLGAALERAGVQLSLIPGHPDDAGGTKPIGDFLLFQGWLLGLPMVWLTVWLIIVGSSSDLDYAPWRLPFFALWLLTAVFFWLGTIVPINAFRGLMLEERAQFTKRFDAELDDRAGAALAQRARAREWSEFVTANDALVEAIKRRQQIAALPSLPLAAWSPTRSPSSSSTSTAARPPSPARPRTIAGPRTTKPRSSGHWPRAEYDGISRSAD